MKTKFVLAILWLCLGAASALAQSNPFTIQDLLQVKRVGDPQVAPDGKLVAYQSTTIDKAANRGRTQIYVVSANNGGTPVQLTNETASSAGPRWSPDGSQIAFSRGGQIWIMAANVTNAKAVTNLTMGASDPLWSPNGQMLAFTSEVYPDCADEACNKERADRDEASKVKAHVTDRLLFRHWTAWKDGKRSHVFVVDVATGAVRDLTPGDYDTPPFSLGGPLDYAFSPDNKELAFARNTEKDEATSTNTDIFLVPLAGGEAQRLTGDNKGYDLSPQYSSGGRYLAYRSQATAGFEADRWRLMLYDRQSKQTRDLTAKFDLQVEEFTFTPDGQMIYFTVGERGQSPIYALTLDDAQIKKVVPDGFNGDVKASSSGKLIFSRSTGDMPTEIFRADSDGSNIKQLTTTNSEFLAPFKLNKLEELEWTGAGKTKIHGFMLKPSDFDATKKYPLLVLIHGGPQSAWNNNWGNRWNPQVFANAGYVVFMPNPRGSTGYGKTFVALDNGFRREDAVRDIGAFIAALKKDDALDPERFAVMGGSYGGYMTLASLIHHGAELRCGVDIVGISNFLTFLTNTQDYRRDLRRVEYGDERDPAMAAFLAKVSPTARAAEIKRPIFSVQGKNDPRVPVTEARQMADAVRKAGGKVWYLEASDEGHGFAKKRNMDFLFLSMLEFFKQHLLR